jgi:hypothetical protein
MRIIENNYKDKEQEYEITCPHCKSKLAYKFDDVISDSFNDNWIYCPVCDTGISICDSNETPTIDTIQYPKDFYSFENAVPIKDDEVNKWVKECINDLDKDTDFSYRASGDTFVFAYKSDEDLPSATVTVAKRYEEADVKIPRKNF